MTLQEFTEIYPYVIAIYPLADGTPVATQPATPTTPTAGTATTTTAPAPTTPVGRVNINTAAKPAMMCIPGLEEADVDAIIAYRENLAAQGQDPTQVPMVTWLLDNVVQVGSDGTSVASKLTQAGPYITGQSTVFSADIVTVTKDGRAFKRVKIVVDDSTGTPQIIYRKDLTDAGWPMSADIRDSLRRR